MISKAKERIRLNWSRRQTDYLFGVMTREVARNAPPAEGKPVVMFNASTRITGYSQNMAYHLLASWALRLQGVKVVHFVCQAGMTRCPLGTNRDDFSAKPPCKDCQWQSFHAYPQPGAVNAMLRGFEMTTDENLETAMAGLGLEALTCFEYEGLPLGALVLPSMRWVLRRHHLADDDAHRDLYRDCIRSAWSVAAAFEKVLDEVDPRMVIVFNGQFFPEATVRYLAQKRGLPVVTHEVGLLPMTAFFTPGEATAYPIDIPETFDLNAEQNARLDTYLEQRFQGNFSMAGVRFWPEMKPLSEEFWQRAGKFKQIVPVFTNVIFDTSQGHANVLFEHMFAWLDQVLDIARAHPETFFIIRAHPDESRPGKAARENVAGWVAQSGALEMPNVLFVDASEHFSSYELIQKSKFVMIYNSTIGMEASLLGAPVLCAGKARFTQLPTVFFPQTAEEHRAWAEKFLHAESIEVPPEFKRNARRFLYYQLYRTSLPMGDFLAEEGIWKGFVTLKDFEWQALLPENSPSLRAVVDGVLHDGDFLLGE
ncbi:capsule polysaccharide biosynthesis protein [Longilinea arvoryzae]|uniref:Capsule polysaccharide biosynthesis protein n=1 Tax=Longilinea arvoryzae TaxID=360412 RepID=A0A0S7BE54_9CHLR|nr:hypothetical protein [Longilinea arvoryzae]GAP13789.1 capsule polysaccharide biosynthesis protein [Longilinea arvoryzae]